MSSPRDTPVPDCGRPRRCRQGLSLAASANAASIDAPAIARYFGRTGSNATREAGVGHDGAAASAARGAADRHPLTDAVNPSRLDCERSKGTAMKIPRSGLGVATAAAMLIAVASMGSARPASAWLQAAALEATSPGCTADRPLRCPETGQCAAKCKSPDPKMQVNQQGCPLNRPLRCPDTGQCAASCKPPRDDPKMQVNSQGCPLTQPLRCPDTGQCATSCKPMRDDPKRDVNAQGCPPDRPLRCPETGQCEAQCKRPDPKMQVNQQGCPIDRPLRCPDSGQCAAVCRAGPAAKK
jgi:hypothetical protein